MVVISSILDRARSPAEWVSLLAERGVIISERTLRDKANRIGACMKLGRAMIITDDHIDRILESTMKCPSNHISEARRGGSAAGSNITVHPSRDIIDAALEHLKSKARGTGAPTKRSTRSASTSSARTR